MQASGELPRRANVELELTHRREALRCARRHAPARLLAQMEQQVNSLEATVARLRDQVLAVAEGKPSRARAEIALDRGLAETALATLLDSPEDDKGRLSRLQPTRPARVVELLLASGRVEEAIARLGLDDPTGLGMLPAPLNLPATAWFHVLGAAALGDCEEADRSLAALLKMPRNQLSSPSGLIASTVAHQLLWDAPLAAGMPWQIHRTMPWLVGLPKNRQALLGLIVQQAGTLLEAETDLIALRGCLALEAGATGQALRHFQRVLLRCQVRQTANRKGRALPYLIFPGLPLAARYAARLEANGSRPDQPGLDE